jgi:tryptophanyl-tRNA synthetase
VIELLDPIRRRYEEIRADETELGRLLGLGADKARAASAPTLAAMYERMGFARGRAAG